MKKISCSFIIASLIILLIAVGSVCAVSDSDLISDGEDWDDDEEDVFEVEDEDDSNDDSEDLDDEDESEDDEDDLDDDSDEDEDLDDEDEDSEDEYETGDYDGEFDGEAFALSASADFNGAKGMSIAEGSNLNNGSQNDVPLSPQTGNPIIVLLMSLLFLIVIPLRNR